MSSSTGCYDETWKLSVANVRVRRPSVVEYMRALQSASPASHPVDDSVNTAGHGYAAKNPAEAVYTHASL